MRSLGALVAILVLALPATAAPRRILPAQDAWPVWSPDGKTIAFTRIDSSGMTREVVRPPSRPVALARNTYQLEPSWSPDGRALAFQAHGGVYVWRSADGSVTGGRCSCGAPAFGPELADVRGTDLEVGGKRWATGVVGQPAWEPAGVRLAFQRDDGIYVIEGANGFPGTPTLLASASNPGRPVWSPDGRSVAYTAGNRIFVVAATVPRRRPRSRLPSPIWARRAGRVKLTPSRTRGAAASRSTTSPARPPCWSQLQGSVPRSRRPTTSSPSPGRIPAAPGTRRSESGTTTPTTAPSQARARFAVRRMRM